MMIACQHLTRWRAHRAAVYLYRCTEMNDLDTPISKAHSAAEATEQQSRQIEARIIKADCTPLLRQYGSAVFC